ncbi:metal-sulfur cluster assembly factor [Flavihumibacter sp. RY-1]|uniref:Metal-sulfur cluster assembly factor n=1 Tax=Flavihumibacter fluminis TaxID=2909236 RepID=A0ABS9BGD0_9BACT|nr:metal-sulfur cluster assembly factor [Flavihumibacter fluminis]MCF1714128.1 metal-sulfur cluster assembly factor [Flavihumibacter fluminis]
MRDITTNNELMATIALAALQDVEDPEIGLNIVDLGLIYQLDFDEQEKKIYCTMTLTTQFCPMGGSIRANCRHRLENAFPGFEIIVALQFHPPWNASRISAEGRKFLEG